jgi:hypothetical protein
MKRIGLTAPRTNSRRGWRWWGCRRWPWGQVITAQSLIIPGPFFWEHVSLHGALLVHLNSTKANSRQQDTTLRGDLGLS